MQPGRAPMDDALKRIVVPHLREVGFKGTMPNFRRLRNGIADLLAVQHSPWGSKFCVNLARCGPEGVQLPDRHIPVEKVKPFLTRYGRRLGASPPFADHWFDYGRAPAAAVAEQVLIQLRDAHQWEMLDARPVG